MLDRLLTPRLSQQVLTLLVKKRKWSISKIARTIDAPADFVRRVQAGKQSLLPKDIESLAKACRQSPQLFVFHAVTPESIPEDLRNYMNQLAPCWKAPDRSAQPFGERAQRRAVRRPRPHSPLACPPGMVSITRKKLLDRVFSLQELYALTAMLRVVLDDAVAGGGVRGDGVLPV